MHLEKTRNQVNPDTCVAIEGLYSTMYPCRRDHNLVCQHEPILFCLGLSCSLDELRNLNYEAPMRRRHADDREHLE